MQRIMVLLVSCFLYSCDDGDLQIETVDFDSITTVDSCEEVSVSQSSVLFKINSDEALILELPSTALVNEATTDKRTSAISASGPSILTYRIFSESVTRNYFCDEIPPITPTVVEDIQATSGMALITTVQSETDTTLYEHTIELQDIVFENGQGEQIIDTRVNDFGTVSTPLEN